MKKAFTLIELLVVVLIIGVLTAIALPKYQVAVQKGRYATLMPAAKSVKNAEEAMLMANGSYSSKLADLDIQLPGTPDGDSKVTNSEGNSFTVSTDDNQSYIRALTKDEKNAYVMYFAKSSRYPGEIHCEALEGDNSAQQVCKSYGNTSTVTGTTSGYTAYVLEGTGTDAGAINTGGGYWNGTMMSQKVANAIAYVIGYSSLDAFIQAENAYSPGDGDAWDMPDEYTFHHPGPGTFRYDPQSNTINADGYLIYYFDEDGNFIETQCTDHNYC